MEVIIGFLLDALQRNKCEQAPVPHPSAVTEYAQCSVPLGAPLRTGTTISIITGIYKGGISTRFTRL